MQTPLSEQALFLATLCDDLLDFNTPLIINKGSKKWRNCTCFFNLETTNLSKSDNPPLFSRMAIFFAWRVLSNFFSTSADAHFFATVPERAPLGNLGRTWGRRLRCESEMTWREAPSFGPSINAYKRLLAHETGSLLVNVPIFR